MNNEATTSATSLQWYQRQQGEWRSSELIGAKVQNNSGDTVGDINDIILTKDGAASAAVIGVGGVLGVGEREVAVQIKSLQLSRDENGNAIAKLNTTKEDLKKAPQWTWQSS
jgi:sporulation protein YlmC with PRC-barrel domain